MAITSLTLTNPGAESGSATGWTVRSGDAIISATSLTSGGTTVTPHSGSRFFYAFTHANWVWDQQVDVSANAAAIDAGTAAIKGTSWKRKLRSDTGGAGCLYISCYAADGTTLLGNAQGTQTSPSVFTQETLYCALPIGTRYVRLGVTNSGPSTGYWMFWDDFTLDLGTDKFADFPTEHFAPRATQVVTYAIAARPAEEVQAKQIVPLTVSAAETSNGFYDVNVHQVVAYALVKKHGDKRKLRAWTFPQDEHKFYVLQLGNSNGTFVYDTLTGQWCRWQSSGEVYWRGEDGCDWEGFNVACDPLSGKIFKIDPEGRLDYNDSTLAEDTPITSVVVGGLSQRFRTNTPCFMAELAVSEGMPPNETVDVSLSLRSGDTLGWYDHGTISGLGSGEKVTVRWYGLGLMSYPGRVFEITDTGYARRIDGLNIELGDNSGA